jgi:hypothetical protein
MIFINEILSDLFIGSHLFFMKDAFMSAADYVSQNALRNGVAYMQLFVL